ncbi:hypothetical protein VTN77DRAFT_7745 [Rasamsonia byssochlamydoides]|uniref:uncharacterized protein n=1 Tax=Rasamsonia byssochlamydoides TaxID=89139 RepID=UPI0037448F00
MNGQLLFHFFSYGYDNQTDYELKILDLAYTDAVEEQGQVFHADIDMVERQKLVKHFITSPDRTWSLSVHTTSYQPAATCRIYAATFTFLTCQDGNGNQHLH